MQCNGVEVKLLSSPRALWRLTIAVARFTEVAQGICRVRGRNRRRSRPAHWRFAKLHRSPLSPSLLSPLRRRSSSSKLEANSFGSAFSCPSQSATGSAPSIIAVRSFAGSHFCRSLPTLSCRRSRRSRILGVTKQGEEARRGRGRSPAPGAPPQPSFLPSLLPSSLPTFPLQILPSNSCGNE